MNLKGLEEIFVSHLNCCVGTGFWVLSNVALCFLPSRCFLYWSSPRISTEHNSHWNLVLWFSEDLLGFSNFFLCFLPSRWALYWASPVIVTLQIAQSKGAGAGAFGDSTFFLCFLPSRWALYGTSPIEEKQKNLIRVILEPVLAVFKF